MKVTSRANLDLNSNADQFFRNMTEVEMEWKTNLTQQVQWLNCKILELFRLNTTQMMLIKGNGLCQVASQKQKSI